MSTRVPYTAVYLSAHHPSPISCIIFHNLLLPDVCMVQSYSHLAYTKIFHNICLHPLLLYAHVPLHIWPLESGKNILFLKKLQIPYMLCVPRYLPPYQTVTSVHTDGHFFPNLYSFPNHPVSIYATSFYFPLSEYLFRFRF